ncbi:MAG: hypothetical protein GF390_03135 [Candidatus Pacebacteria bacterium]|nr:hypothetical protein [Candidatus Paceibacterota bacterium]
MRVVKEHLKVSVFLTVLLLMIVVPGLTWLFTQVLVVQQVECLAADQVQAQQLCVTLTSLKGQSLFFRDFFQEPVVKELQQAGSGFALVKLEKKLPNTLRVFLQEEPLVYQVLLLDQPVQLVSHDGRLFKTDDQQSSLPMIYLDQAELTTERHQQLLELLAVLDQQQIEFKKIEVFDQQQVRVWLLDNKTVWFELQNISTQAQRLALVLKQVNWSELESPVSEIDVRFKLPVLR